MPYNYAAFTKLIQEFNFLKVYIIYWDHKKLTPYEFSEIKGIEFIKRSLLTKEGLLNKANEISPDLIFVSGWMDQGYIKVCKEYVKRGKKVLCGIDNWWRPNLKLEVKAFVSKLISKKYFTHAFVPGLPQYEFARRIGFKHDRIITGLYTADVDKFNRTFHQTDFLNKDKTILYIGRLENIKGIDLLIYAFEDIQRQPALSDWNLCIVGNGKLPVNKDIKNINYISFTSQDELAKITSQARIFCLPSRFEPWGLVLHEMAAAGMPLITSDLCGAASEFLIDGYNGFTFKSGNLPDLKNKLAHMMKLDIKLLAKMGQRSFKLSNKITPKYWCHKLMSVLDLNSDKNIR